MPKSSKTIPGPLYTSPVLTTDGRQLPSRGGEVCRWIERNVRLGPGDYYGQPFRLTDFQRRWIWRLFEFWPETGLYRYKRALFGTGKGNGKTPIEGAIGAEGLCGPTAPIAPLVLVAASALGQANLVFGDLKAGMTHDASPLKPFIEAFDLNVQLRDGTGEIKRVAAATGSNDGPRATRLLADELHEWTGRLANVFDVLDGAIGKRQNAFTVAISTAGSDRQTLLGRMYDRGRKIASGEIVDDETLFEWYEIPEGVEIPEVIRTKADLARWREAIVWANPALIDGGFLHESYIRSRFDGAQSIERYKWLRYHGNRWTGAETSWLPAGRWADCGRVGRSLEPGAEVVLAFSGTYDRDSAGLVAIGMADGFVQRLGVWEDPEDEEYEVPAREVSLAVRAAMERYRVRRMVCNPNGWHGEAQEWAGAWGSKTVTLFDWMHQLKRRHDACSRFYTSVLTGELGHDGDPAIARHLESASIKETSEGAWIQKSSRTGPPIDLAVAAVLAWDSIGALQGERKKTGTLVTM